MCKQKVIIIITVWLYTLNLWSQQL